jgi:inhibitor of KinA
MSQESIRIFPLGDDALTVEFGNEISETINKKAIGVAAYFERHPFPGFIEAVPAYSSATIFYDLAAVRKCFPEFPTAFDAVRNRAEAAINAEESDPIENQRTIEIPFRTDKESAPDLEFVAKSTSLTPAEVIEIFTSVTYRIFMLGFLPGFAYMGEVDERLAMPRKETPRLKVPIGSVAITGRQTGVYSLESPGGWQIIGRTNVEMFTPRAKLPCLLNTGDRVRFVAIK